MLTIDYYTQTLGIYRQRKWLEISLGQQILFKPFSMFFSQKKNQCFIGWGHKPNTQKVRQWADLAGVPFIRMENGFIGYIGHPAQKGIAVSLIADHQGIYYDSRQSSDFEQLMLSDCSEADLTRAQHVWDRMIALGITKYNCFSIQQEPYPKAFSHFIKKEYVLLIDQVAGDSSVVGARASEPTFLEMVRAAKARFPHAKYVIRTHPDVKLKRNKQGALLKYQAHPELQDVIWVTEPCHPHILLRQAIAVYTVSSQLGFEALLYRKPVYCFGMPFYAGWGLTHDTLRCDRRAKRSLLHLIACALIRYPIYYDPILRAPTSIEATLNFLAAQQASTPRYTTLYAVGFSLWKRYFIQVFAKKIADKIIFISQPKSRLIAGTAHLIWGQKFPQVQQAVRVEDGFIRSVGLGSNLTLPSSIVFDDLSLYFNAQKESRLLKLCHEFTFELKHQQRGQNLIRQLIKHQVNKYNLKSNQCYTRPNTDRKVCLVVGQVDGDASIVTGSPVIKSNQELLYAVRAAYPQAYILYKPHPDVVSGNREGSLSSECINQCIDAWVHEHAIHTLFPCIDVLHTMTSLAGFEALLQDVPVITWGQPFYSGWGLTQDKHPPIRQRALSLEQLSYLIFVEYAYYMDWQTQLWSTPEQLIIKIAQSKHKARLNRSVLLRSLSKVGQLLFLLKVR